MPGTPHGYTGLPGHFWAHLWLRPSVMLHRVSPPPLSPMNVEAVANGRKAVPQVRYDFHQCQRTSSPSSPNVRSAYLIVATYGNERSFQWLMAENLRVPRAA